MIKKLVNSKATGIHGIPDKAFKEYAENMASSLTDIFNFSVEVELLQYMNLVKKMI